MTNQIEKAAPTAGKLVREERERQQRASAPTLRDLQAAPVMVIAKTASAASSRADNSHEIKRA